MAEKTLLKKSTLFSVNISDMRGKNKACEICGKDFSILTKEHQCKRCKRSVCFSCSQSKQPVFRLKKFSNKPHRICSRCKVESEKLQAFIKQNKIVFGKDTISTQWLKSLNNQQSYSDITSEYSEFLNDPQFELNFQQSDAKNYKLFKELHQSMPTFFDQLLDDFNYSLQEFLHFVVSTTDQATIVIQIKNILKALLNKHPEVGLTNEIVMVIFFFLCFSSEPIAFCILSKLYSQIYPKQLYFKEPKSNVIQYTEVITQLLETGFKVS